MYYFFTQKLLARLQPVQYTPHTITDMQELLRQLRVTMSSSKGAVTVCRGSEAAEYSEDKATEILSEEELTIDINMNQGEACASAWGCDLTYDYVKINGSYRS